MIRIDRANRDHTELLTEEWQWSAQWNSAPERDCRGCPDCDGTDNEVPGFTCEGAGRIDDIRHGVSVCRDEDDLITYLAHTGAQMNDCVLVELEGPYSGDEGHDADLGEHLILPTRIASIAPVTDAFAAAVYDRYEQIHGAAA